MKKNTAVITISLIAAVTVAMTFIQPTVIHQLVMWVSGLFAVVVALALFAVSNWPQQNDNRIVSNNFVEGKKGWSLADNYDVLLINRVKRGRSLGVTDEELSQITGADIDVIKAIP